MKYGFNQKTKGQEKKEHKLSLFLNTSQSGINSAAQANGKRWERIAVKELSLSLFNTCYLECCSLKSGKLENGKNLWLTNFFDNSSDSRQSQDSRLLLAPNVVKYNFIRFVVFFLVSRLPPSLHDILSSKINVTFLWKRHESRYWKS